MSGFLVYSLDVRERNKAVLRVRSRSLRRLTWAVLTDLSLKFFCTFMASSSSSSSSGECFLTSALAFGHLHCRPGSFLAVFVAGFLRRRILETKSVFYTKPTKNATKLIQLLASFSHFIRPPRVQNPS